MINLPTNFPKTKTLTLTAETDQLDDVLRFVMEPLDALGCSEEVKTVLAIAVEEIYVNIAHYAYTAGHGPVTIRWELGGSPLSVLVEFMDHGKPYNPLSRPDPDLTLSAEERQIGGLGIYMVRQSMDEVSYAYRDSQNCFSMRKILFPAGA